MNVKSYESQALVFGHDIQFVSNILNEERLILVSLPHEYGETITRYPVLYQLDGYPALFQLAVGTLRYLSEWEEDIARIILVSIPNTNRDRDVFPTQVTLPTGETIGGGAANFLKFIEGELVPYIDSQYRTLPIRVLYGTSNSGLTAIYSLLTQSKVFDAFIASSPTLSWDDNFIFQEAETAFRDWKATQKFLYITCGKEDLGNIRQENHDFASFLADQSPDALTWGFRESDEERHCPYCSLHDGLMTLFSEWGFLSSGRSNG